MESNNPAAHILHLCNRFLNPNRAILWDYVRQRSSTSSWYMCPTWRAIDSETFCTLKLDKFSFIVAVLLVLLMFVLTTVFMSWTSPALWLLQYWFYWCFFFLSLNIFFWKKQRGNILILQLMNSTFSKIYTVDCCDGLIEVLSSARTTSLHIPASFHYWCLCSLGSFSPSFTELICALPYWSAETCLRSWKHYGSGTVACPSSFDAVVCFLNFPVKWDEASPTT